MLKGIGLLIVWFVTIVTVGSLVAPGLSRTSYPQPLDILVLACVPLGAYHAAQYRMPGIIFLLYGMACSSVFVHNFIYGTGPYRRGAAGTTRMTDWICTIITCLVVVGLGLACRFVAQWRGDREDTRSNKDLCSH